MFDELPPIDILILAAIAAVVIYRLYQQFGKQVDTNNNEEPTPLRPKPKEKPVLKPLFSPEEEAVEDKKTTKKRKSWQNNFQALDSSFTEKSFFEGASIAFEMITNAAADGDTKMLKPLVKPSLFDQLCKEMKQRDSQNQTLEVELVGINNMAVKKANLKGSVATIQTIIDSEQYYCLYDEANNLIAGDNEEVIALRDIWHFQRDLSSADPNWKLIKMEEVSEDSSDIPQEDTSVDADSADNSNEKST